MRGADGQRRPAEPGQRDRLRVDPRGVVGTGVVLAQARTQRNHDLLELHASERGRPDTHARVGLHGEPVGVGLDDEQRRLAVELCGDDEDLGVGGRGDQRLLPVEAVTAGGAHRGGLRRGRVEQGMRLGDRNTGLRDVLPGELLQIRGLLVGAAPVRQRGCDAAGRQDRQCQTHVAVGEGFGDERVGDRAAVFGDPLEVLGDVDGRDAEFGGFRDEVGRVHGRFVGVVCGGSQDLFGELVDRLDDHLLVVVGCQVEVVGTARGPRCAQPGRRLCETLNAFELPRRRSGCGEHGSHSVPKAAIEWIAQVVLVQELLPQQRSDQGQSDVGGGAPVLLQAHGALGAGPFGREGVRHGQLPSCGGPRCAVCATDSRVRYLN